jgi:hypothetical protein
MHGRILSFNASVAHVWAEQQRELEQAGRRMPIEDSYIAATARRYNLTIVTGNDKHYRRPGLKVFNPFVKAPSQEWAPAVHVDDTLDRICSVRRRARNWQMSTVTVAVTATATLGLAVIAPLVPALRVLQMELAITLRAGA